MGLKWGIVGVAGIGRSHAKALQEVGGIELYAACDIVPEALEAFCEEFQVPHRFTDFRELLRSEVEALSICTPHFLHAEQVIAALEAGKHVLCEKPLAIRISEADEMIAASERAKGKAGVVFQFRLHPVLKAVKALIGGVGEIVRGFYEHHHFRTQAYYRQGRWRGTWGKEGGGLLINQSIHDLDTLVWIFGLPQRVTARLVNWGHENIEVEDMAAAILEWDNGAQVIIQLSTVTYAVPMRLEVTGTNGTILCDGKAIRFGRYMPSLRRYIRESQEAWGRPEVAWEDVPVDTKQPRGHGAAIRQFAEALLKGEPSPVPFAEARKSLELMNAFVLSHFTGQTVSLPLDPQAYDELWRKLCRGEYRLVPPSV